MKSKIIFICIFFLQQLGIYAQQSEITIHASRSMGDISPYVYGQFIEYMGTCIDGGLYDENSSLSDSCGFREDVLDKVRELAPTLLRFPGGTMVKTFHWEDGIGPKEQRKAKKNLVWGGVTPYHFGTCEFIEYCREIGCEPVLVVNISTGTPDEAANWVEYCNGTEDTYYANLRRSHGYPEPFNVKYWALGNEEAAEPDAGRHQDPQKYVTDVWHFIKLMKLTDPTIKLIANGESNNFEWSRVALKGLDGAVDYISYHAYVGTDSGKPYSIFHKIKDTEFGLNRYAQMIKETVPDEVKNWKKWYRFPHRTQPVKIALDEWGIWEYQEPPYGTTNTYDWRHGLATACFLNAIHRCAEHIGMANWAQMVNILAPIRTDKESSVRQTVFFPLKEYRAKASGKSVWTEVVSPAIDERLQSLDVSAVMCEEKGWLTLFVVNISSSDITTKIHVLNGRIKRLLDTTRLSAPSLAAKNVLSEPTRNVVNVEQRKGGKKTDELVFGKESITICRFELEK